MVFCKFIFIIKTLYFILLTVQYVASDRTSRKIYESIKGDIFCFRRLNATHQIGCASNRNGNIGIVHVVDSVDDVLWVTENGTNPPYIVALPMNFFNMNNMTILRNSGRVAGVLILKENNSKPEEGFSPDQSCPNRNFDLYTVNETFTHLSVKWNPDNPAINMMYEDWKMPVFLISENDSISAIRNKCYEKFNKPKDGVDQKWPLCAAQLKSGMMAAKDSSTCMRRSKLVTNINPMKVCDPLSDRNVVTMLFHTNKSEEIANRSVIVVGARLDAFSLFDRLAPGAHTAVTGLVTLLAIAHTISACKDDMKVNVDNSAKNILFAIFNGEAFDYIGSSRIVFDMKKGVFPVEIIKSIPHQQAPVSLHHISHFIELSQLAPPSNHFWLHVDPISTQLEDVNASVNALISELKQQSSQIPVKLKHVPSQQQLPPSSIQSFLKHDDQIAGVVIADHEKAFVNKYYNSLFDTLDKNDIPKLSEQLANLATVVSRTLYKILTGKSNESIIANETLLAGMLNCYLINASCNLFHEIADPDKTSRLRDDPYPLYVSVETGSNRMNAITAFTRYLLAYLTGSKVENSSRADCTLDADDQIYQYDWMVGPGINSSGICVKSTVMYTLAISPAFVLDDWHSTTYSTWTESVWEEISVRIFLQPSRLQEGLTLAVGIVIFILSILTVYFANKRASILFGVRNLVGC